MSFIFPMTVDEGTQRILGNEEIKLENRSNFKGTQEQALSGTPVVDGSYHKMAC